MDIKNSVAATLRQIGKDERWLQEWIIEDNPESNIPVPQAARVTLRSNIQLKKNNNMDDARSARP